MEKADAQDQKKNYEREDIYDADYVIAATNDHQIKFRHLQCMQMHGDHRKCL